MTSDLAHTQQAALGDEFARAPVFFSEHVALAVEGKPIDQALADLGKLISEATVDKECGYGPPQSELNSARRKWLDLYAQSKRAA
jgi:hypothetical protein